MRKPTPEEAAYARGRTDQQKECGCDPLHRLTKEEAAAVVELADMHRSLMDCQNGRPLPSYTEWDGVMQNSYALMVSPALQSARKKLGGEK